MCSAQGWDLFLWPSRCYDNTTESRQPWLRFLIASHRFWDTPKFWGMSSNEKNLILSRNFNGKLWLLEFFCLLRQSLRLVFFLQFWFYRTWVRVLKSNGFVTPGPNNLCASNVVFVINLDRSVYLLFLCYIIERLSHALVKYYGNLVFTLSLANIAFHLWNLCKPLVSCNEH